MAKRKKGRRLGAIAKRRAASKRSMERLLGVVAGAAATGLLRKMIPADKVDPKIISGGGLVLGYLLPGFVKGDFFAGAGDGLVAASGLSLLQEFGVVSGMPLISGYTDMRQINGIPEQLNAFVSEPNNSDASQAVRMTEVMSGMSRGYDEDRIS